MTKEELKRAYTERLPVIWHSHRDEIEYKYIHELRAKESRSGKRVLYAVLADYCGHSYTVADPRQLRLKESTVQELFFDGTNYNYNFGIERGHNYVETNI